MRTTEQRFWAKVNKTSGCWLWTGATSGGYGYIRINGKGIRAHGWAWESVNGPVPGGLELDHAVCQNPGCVRPDHLEAVTHAVNCQRGRQGKYQLAKTHCPRGHEYNPENTRRYRGRRHCRACDRLRDKVRDRSGRVRRRTLESVQ